eukprot:2875064-Prymnesium_polylepis.1
MATNTDEPLHLPKVEARRARRVELRHALFHPALVHAQICRAARACSILWVRLPGSARVLNPV